MKGRLINCQLIPGLFLILSVEKRFKGTIVNRACYS